MSARVAAIDCGTNSVRLLVTDDGRPLERINRITRLGRGVDATGRLDPEAIARTIDALRDYREIIDRHGVDRIRMTCTSASRDAANRDEFFAAVRATVGIEPELISGTEEGALSFAGATADLDPGLGPFLVCDIGGGSTEFIIGTDAVDASISVDIGCVRMTEAWLHHDPPLAEELSQALSVIDIHLDDVERALPSIREVSTFVGLAGTITNVAAVEQGLAEYDPEAIHHFVLTKAAVEDVFRTLATESIAERITNPGLEAARADVIVGGLCVLVAIMRRFGFQECLVSEADILDGLAASVAAR